MVLTSRKTSRKPLSTTGWTPHMVAINQCRKMPYVQKAMGNILTAVLVAWFVLLSNVIYAAEVTAKLSENIIVENQVVQLTIRADVADTGNGPDFSVLEKDFTILNQSQSSQFSFNLGASQSRKYWIVSLMPKSAGVVQIPAIPVGQYASNPLTLEVKTSPALLDENGNPPILIEVEVSDLQPYLQQEVIIRLKLYHAFALQNANISTPKHVDLVMERLTDDQVHYETIKDTDYQVLTREYLAFPQRSGVIEIEPQKVAAMINTNRGRRLIKAQSKPIKLNVLPVPTMYPSENWLPAKDVVISSTLKHPTSRQAGAAQVGDTLIWQITTIADGAFPEQIPTLEFVSTKNYKLYPQQPTFSSSKSTYGIRGEQTVNIEVVPTAPGTLTLPNIELPYWDIKNRRVKHSHATGPSMEITGLPIIDEKPVESGKKKVTALLKPQSRSVAPISLAKTESDQKESAELTEKKDVTVDLSIKTGEQWSLKHILLASLLMVTAIALCLAVCLRLYKNKSNNKTLEEQSVPTLKEFAPLKTANEDSAYHDLLTVCRSNQLPLLRSALLEWARHRWGEEAIRGLDDIKELSQSNSLKELLMEAELIMYSDQTTTEWDGTMLANALEEFYSGESKPTKESQLKSLYPDL
ncbi:protein BatD [Marinomonas agarivorans]|nr:protein BatD [Marinomonas agarivorans]